MTYPPPGTELEAIHELLASLERRRPLVIAPPGVLTDAHRALLAEVGAEVREDEYALPGRIIMVNRAALDDAWRTGRPWTDADERGESVRPFVLATHPRPGDPGVSDDAAPTLPPFPAPPGTVANGGPASNPAGAGPYPTPAEEATAP